MCELLSISKSSLDEGSEFRASAASPMLAVLFGTSVRGAL
jgi:hypothetical protein